ncbi:MAG: Probable drug resistance transport protein, partial [uncultured Acetobacteraceae bacterium]
ARHPRPARGDRRQSDPARRVAFGAARRAGLPARPERRRQDHHHGRGHGPPPLFGRLRPLPRRRTARPAAARHRAHGRRLQPGGVGGLRRPDRGRERRPADLDPAGGPPGPGADRARLHGVPEAPSVPRPRRRAALGRRAQDGLHRPRARARPRPAAAGRALRGALARGHPRDRARRRRRPRRGPRGADRRKQPAPRPRRRRPHLRDRAGGDRLLRRLGGPARGRGGDGGRGRGRV